MVNDITRSNYQTDFYLSILIDKPTKILVPDKNSTIIIHRPHSAKEDELIISTEVYKQIKVENHYTIITL